MLIFGGRGFDMRLLKRKIFCNVVMFDNFVGIVFVNLLELRIILVKFFSLVIFLGMFFENLFLLIFKLSNLVRCLISGGMLLENEFCVK